MRVGLVSPYSLSLPGGVQGQILGLARSLRSHGHTAVVLGPCDGAPPEPGIRPLGESLPTASNGSVAPIAPDVACALRTIRGLWDEEVDIVHVHEPIVPGPPMTATLMHTAPTVGTFHAAGSSKAYRLPTVAWMARRLDRRVAVSEDAARMAHDALGGEYTILFNGIEVDRHAKADPWPTGPPTVLYLGRHEPRKGLGVLLDALAHLPPDIRVWVASDGPDTAALRARHRGDDRIEWLGRVSEGDKLSRLRGADVVCFPSLHGESFGVVLLEGMAARTPVVASDLPGYRNVATHDRDALLVPPGDPAALGGALRRVLTDPSLAGRLVEAGTERAEHLSMDRLAEAYLAIYDELLSA